MRQKLRRALILVSFLIFPITMNYFSPYLIIDASAQGIINGSLITFTLLFVFSLLFGRAFCGWACPGAGLQEACFSIRDKRTWGGKYNWIKFYIWIPWMAAIVLVAVMAGGYTEINPLYMLESGISVAQPGSYIMYFFVLALFVVPALSLGKRAFCHYICWMAPFMVIGTRIRNFFRWYSLHLKADKTACQNCKSCNAVCPMSLDVNGMVQREDMRNTECILCGSCVDNCAKHAIRYAWKG